MKSEDRNAIRNLVLGPALLLAGVAFLSGCERPPVETTQNGFRGTGMVDVQNPRLAADDAARHIAPASLPPSPEGGPLASAIYKNVPVLGGLTVAEFTRTMVAMTNWVSPTEGCNYCHNPADLASDEKYTKVVSRRMIEMTQHINASWQPHVGETGVTCHTCHRGQAVPEYIWFADASAPVAKFAGNRAGQNAPAEVVGLTSLPLDPFSTFLEGNAAIRVEGTEALPHGNMSSIKQGEWTYGLMMHFSQSLGVNCTYCHNSRHFSDWEQSPPTRAKAWHGINMARGLNTEYLVPLRDVFPAERRGPSGDAPKVYCATCHQGAAKPLNGAAMLKDYGAALAAPLAAAAPAPAAEPAPATEEPPGAPAAEEAPAADEEVMPQAGLPRDTMQDGLAPG